MRLQIAPQSAAFYARLLFAAGGLVVVAAFGGTSFAKEKPKQTCFERLTACEGRCVQRYPGNPKQQSECRKRTCNKQYDNCIIDQIKDGKMEGITPGQKPGIVQTPPVLDKPGGVTAPPSGGILDTSPVFRGPKPAPGGKAAPN